MDSTSIKKCWYFGLVLFVLSFLVTGYRWYAMNHAIQLPLVAQLNDPSLFPNDIFADVRPSWVSYLWTLVAWLNRFIALEPLLLGLFLIERAFLFFSVSYLVKTLWPKNYTAAIIAMGIIAIGPAPFIGGAAVVQNYFEQTAFSIPFYLMAFAEFYRKRPYTTAIWMALGFALNPLYGFFTLTYLIGVLITDWRTIPKWIGAGILFVVLSIPTIFLTLQTYSLEAADPSLWLAITLKRSAIHFDPLSWPVIQYLKHFALMALSVWALYYVKDSKLRKHGIVWTVVSLLWVIFGFLTAYVLNKASLQEIHPVRGAGIWLLLAYFFISIGAAKKTESWKYTPVVVVLIVALLGTAISLRRYHLTGHAILKPPRAKVVDVASWAGNNTPVDSMFLIPPNWHEFRAVSLRPVFVTWKDGAVIMWDRSRTGEWHERFKAIGFDVLEPHDNLLDDVIKAYDDLTDERVAELADEYELDFRIVKSDFDSEFNVIYDNGDHKILDLSAR